METDSLFERYRSQGSTELRNQIVEQHLALVHHVARKVQGRGDHGEYDDLVSAGVLGLMDAVENFDPERGWAFSTYAAPRIRGAILDDLRRRDHATRSVRKKERAMAQAREALRHRLEREPHDQEVARELELSVETLWAWQATVTQAGRVSLDRPLDPSDDASATPEELLVGQDGVEIEDAVTRLQEVELLQEEIAVLSEQERTVLSLYYFEELTLRQIGEVLGLTESRISQIRSKALATLSEKMAGRSPAPVAA